MSFKHIINTMNKIAFILIMTGMFFIKGYAQRTEVLTLGVFHFDFPNLDMQQISEEDQINVLSPVYQKEIELIASKLANFKPDAIVIEHPLGGQQKVDSLFKAYLAGNHKLSKSEVQQLGFRIAKMCKAKIYCGDARGTQTARIEELLEDDSTKQYQDFEESFVNSPDSSLYSKDQLIFKQKGILPQLIHLNDPRQIKKDLGNYLIGHFKYESDKGDYTGADFESGRWFNRNLRIFRNIQRTPKSAKRILVIFGAAHMNLLNYLFECSPEYKLLNVNDYLKTNS